MAEVPTITGLRAAIHGDAIILSWADDGPEAKAYAVYRSETPFSGTSLAGRTSIAVVAPGKQGYVDRPPQGSSFYYAVAAISSEGQVLFAFRANQNATVVAIAAEAPQTPAPSPQPPALSAAPAGATAAASQPASGQLSTAPLTGGSATAKMAPAEEKKLPEARPKTSAESPQVAEAPRPTEAAAAPVIVPAAEPMAAAVPRSTPLPAFLYGDSSILPGATGLTDAAGSGAGDLPPETAKALHQLQDETEPVVFAGPELRLLPRTQREGDAATIILAAESLLSEGDWRGARAILEPLARSGKAGAERDCAHFYIGIALAKEGSYRDALFEFLAAREAYPAQTKPWIDFVVEGLARP